MLKTPADIIEAKGGAAAFAAAIGSTYGAVRTAKHRNKLPRTVWPDIIKAFPDLSLDDLTKAEEAGAKAYRRKIQRAAA